MCILKNVCPSSIICFFKELGASDSESGAVPAKFLLRSQRMSRWFITIKKTTAAPSPVKFTQKNIAQIKFST